MKISYKLSFLILLTFFCFRGMAQYCTPEYSSGCSGYDDGLVNFHLNTINQTISCSGSPSYYHNFTAVSTTLLVNTSYTLNIMSGEPDTYVTIWVDYNNDNVFGPSEVLLSNYICINEYEAYTTSITIPSGSALGSHRLRYRTNWAGTIDDPCISYSYGNSCDFTINVTEPGYCAPSYTTGCVNGDGLVNFKLNTIDQAIPCTGTPSYYHNFTAVSTNITATYPYTVTVQAGSAGTNVEVWVDMNNNYTFDQPTDVMISNIVCTNAFQNYTASLTIPGGTSPGIHRLRYRTSYGSSPGDPCAALTYGNSADFNINVQAECTPSYSSGCIFGDGLSSFKLNSINQPILCDGVPNGYYHNYSGVSTEVAVNVPTTITVQAGFGDTYVTVWVDLNNNHIFDQPSETLLGLYCLYSYTDYSGTFTIPAGTSLGTHLLRFRTNWLSAPSDPCASYSYGNAADFSVVVVQPTPPIVATTMPSLVSPNGGTLNGTINPKGSPTTVTFEYGLTNAYGFSVAGVPATVAGTFVTPVQAVLTGLIPNQTYHYRIIGNNVAGTSYGEDMIFMTCPAGPAGPITGSEMVCRGTEGVVYYVEPILNATGYVWTLPQGAIITDGDNTNSITVDYTVTSVSGNVGVYGFSECGSGIPSQLPVIINIAPDPIVSGPEVVCANDPASIYTTQPGMSDYEWWVSPNGIITGGGSSTDTSISVIWYSNGAGSVKVNYNNGTECASTYQPYHQVVINYQPIPVITGLNVTCVGIEGNLYTTDPGMTDYTWTLSTGGTVTSGGTTDDSTIIIVWNTPGNHSVNVNYSGPNGCRATDPTIFPILVNPAVAPTISGFAVATIGGMGYAYFTEANWSNYSWNVSSGGTITAGGTSETNNVVVVWNTPGPNWVSVNYFNGNCTQASATVYDFFITEPLIEPSIAGIVSYANQAETPMKNTTVKLKDQNGNVIRTTITDNSGTYSFLNVQPGFYTVEGQTTKPWGGANSTDALLTMKHFIMSSTLSGISLSAADVNASSSVNAVDALMIAKRYVNQVSGFAAGDWVFEISPVMVTNSDITHNMKSRCYGDLNGSYTPPEVKLPATITLQQQGSLEISSMMSFDMPFRLDGNSTVGAVSLIMNYPADFLSVEGVEMDNTGELSYSTNNGELRISWYSLNGINTDNQLLTLKLRSKDLSHATAETLAFSLEGSSELSDRNAVVVQNANVICPKLAVTTNAVSLTNYPNPFVGTTTINFNIPVDGNISLVLYNLLGEEVSILINKEYITASNRQVTLSSSNLEAGVYVCKLYVADMVYSHRITVIK